MPAIHAGMTKLSPFSSSVGERTMMKHSFVVKALW
jgi:hypothetical protein